MPALDVRIQAQGRSPIDLTGTLDSGATGTALSKRTAQQLGLTPADLHKAEGAIIADDSEVACWTTIVPIRAQVLRPIESGDLLPWGPVFAVNPVFLEHASPLWGLCGKPHNIQYAAGGIMRRGARSVGQRAAEGIASSA